MDVLGHRGAAEPEVSVVIANFGAQDYLMNCLQSVLRTDYDNFEVIVVDNASRDSGLDELQAKSEVNRRVILVRNAANLGFGQANNLGFAKSKGEYVFFLNNDTLVEPDWLIEAVKVMNGDCEIAAAQSKLLLLKDRARLDSTGDFIDSFGLPSRRGYGEIDLGQYDAKREIFSARGAAMIVRRNAFKEVGGFDSLFFLGCEDLDLSWRMRLAGYRVEFVPRSRVYHAGGVASSKVLKPQMAAHWTRGYLLMNTKNLGAGNFARRNPILVVFAALAFDLFERRSPEMFQSRAKVLFWYLGRFKRVYKRRRTVQTLIRRRPDSDLFRLILVRSLRDELRAAIERNGP